ncbi:MAG TPA: hypothetical protein VIK95_15190 [Egibacteraceae bacterium]
METTSTSLVSRIIEEGRHVFGDLDAVEVPRDLWEQVMDEVAAAGGEVGFDACTVDGVRVRARPDGPGADEPRYRPAGQEHTRPLPR